MPKQWLIGCVVLAMAAATLQADDVSKGRLTHRGVTVTGINDGELTFRKSTGDVLKVSLSELTAVSLDGHDSFNTAEAALKDKNYDEALRGYRAAMQQATQRWQKDLIQFRRLRTFDTAARIDKALELWKQLCQQSRNSEKILAMMPKTLGEAGSSANAAAIKLLTTDRPAADTSDYDARVTELLMNLYEQEGRDEEVAREAARLAGEAVADEEDEATDDEEDEVVDEARPADPSARLKAAKVRLDQAGGAAAVVGWITEDLDSYDEEMLAEAMLLLGKAKRMLADQAADDADQAEKVRQLRLEAGIHLMIVAALYADAPEAAEALFEAAGINEALGNMAAARNAYDTVRSRYADSPFAQQATDALARTSGN
ncbi:MAG: hypothetical protein ACYS8X_00440 [Planctomycetota bacterium]|jgi:hypothetical protein